MAASHPPGLRGNLDPSPPMQTHSRPHAAHPPRSLASGVHAAIKKKKTPPPILASEVLREDLAPTEPGRRASRLWDAVVAVLFLAVGICLRFDLGVADLAPQAGAICLAAAAAIGATALVPFPYVWRAAVGGLVGAVVVVAGLFGGGPLALLGDAASATWLESFRVITCVALPAALLFRSHYRAYERGRVLLATSFVLALPFLVEEAFLATQGVAIARVGAALALTGTLSALIAFMPAPTTSVTAWCAQTLTFLVALELGLRQFHAPLPAGSGPLAYALTGVAFFASVVPIALGLFQMLSFVYSREARLVDLHRRPSEPPRETQQPASSD